MADVLAGGHLTSVYQPSPGALYPALRRLEGSGEVIAFLEDLGRALEGFIQGMEEFIAARPETMRGHALLALEHGIAIHRASLEWVGSAMAALGETSSMPGD